jgi:hypothetical protein
MNKVITIYCEGKAGSSDFDILSKVIDDLTVKIKPIGGKRGAKSAIQVYEESYKSDLKLFFRDRDFDKPVPNSISLIKDSYVYFSYRTTIENYLIDFDTIKDFSKGKSWDSADLNTKFIQAAKDIKYFQAMRHTLGALRIPTDFGTNIMEKSGLLPPDLSKNYCNEQGYLRIEESKTKTTRWTREKYNEMFNKFSSLFSDDFIESYQFLIWFQGKDFMKSLCKTLGGLSPKDYYQFSKARFDYTKYPDLVQLRELLK